MPHQWDIEECYAFKVFGPPSGALTAFWSNEWNEHRQSTNVGAFVGRNVTHQRQTTVDTAAERNQPQAMPGTVGDLRPARNAAQVAGSSSESRRLHRQDMVAALDSIAASSEHFNNIMSWNFQNIHHAQRVTALQNRISFLSQPSQSSGCDSSELPAMHTLLNDLLHAPLATAPVPSAVARSRGPGAPQIADVPASRSSTELEHQDRNVRARHTVPSSEEENSDTLARALNNLFSRFAAIEIGIGAGDCLFYVLQHLQNHEILHETLARVNWHQDEDVSLTRSLIADHLERRTAEDAENPLLDPAGVALSVPMIEEKGSVAAYIAWIRELGTSGGYIELVAWANLFQVRVKLFSTTIFSGNLVEEEINWHVEPPVCGGVRGNIQTFHILHRVDIGGRGGHYQLLQTLLPSADAAASAAVIDLVSEGSPSH
jgi:hypothetical protein